MTAIRPADRADLPGIVDLAQTHLLSEPLPGGDNADFLRRTLFDAPWADPELPSLVADDAGRVVGFVGVQPRTLSLDGREVRAVCASHLVVAADARTQAVGPRLVRALLDGPQDLTWSDSATEVVARMWQASGGFVDPGRSLDWELVLRPAAWTGRVLSHVARGSAVDREIVPVAGVPLQALGRRLTPRAFPEPLADVTSEPADAATGSSAVDGLSAASRLRTVWLPEHLEAVLSVAALHQDVVHRTVHHRGRLLGWYVLLLRRRTATVVAMLAHPRAPQAALQAALDEARSQGAVVVAGRLEGGMVATLQTRMPVLGFARRPVIHARDAALAHAATTPGAALQRLEGEWWVT